ncbi:MAG: hypothetical protein L0211_21595, partial [Planctomycetaceae bacterium]|nr:hypothetical protein [Planctomycetaceae bacterium]
MTGSMTYHEPIYCRPEAFQFFVDQMPVLWKIDGLVRAAIAVSMHALDDVVPEQTESQIRALSARVQAAASGSAPSHLQAALHQVM